MSTRESFGGVAAGRPVPLFPAAIAYDDLVLLSGQAPLDAATGAVVDGDFRAQARRVLDQISQTLDGAGSGMDHVLRVVCILADAGDFAVWNEEFEASFPAPRPVRTTIVAGFVLPGMLIEVEVTAARRVEGAAA
jgi:2-iminobutanoate/2-iminopropanoate deaminase